MNATPGGLAKRAQTISAGAPWYFVPSCLAPRLVRLSHNHINWQGSPSGRVLPKIQPWKNRTPIVGPSANFLRRHGSSQHPDSLSEQRRGQTGRIFSLPARSDPAEENARRLRLGQHFTSGFEAIAIQVLAPAQIARHQAPQVADCFIDGTARRGLSRTRLQTRSLRRRAAGASAASEPVPKRRCPIDAYPRRSVE
jgi:hypothetical protein